MELLTLNLQKDLEWSQTEARLAGLGNVPEAAAAVGMAPEGAECALFWDWNVLVDKQGDDGPRSRRPLPFPASIAASGLAEKPASGAPGTGHSRDDVAMRLAAGSYLFVQTRAPALLQGAEALEDWLADSIEWFAREAWWTGAKTSGPLLVRLVREDKKTAVQIVRKLA